MSAEYGEEVGRDPRPPLRRRVPGGLQGGLPRPHCCGRPRPAGGDPGRVRHRPGALLRARRPRRGGTAQGVPRGPAALAVRSPPDAVVDGRRGGRRATLRPGRDRPGVPHLRLRPALRRTAARPGARALLRRPAGDLGRLHRDRRVQRPGAAGVADLAAGDAAARLREVHATGELALRHRLDRGGARRQRRAGADAGQPLRDPLRPGLRRRGARPGPGRPRGAHQEGARRGREPRPRPDPSLLPDPHPGDPAHQLLPARGRRAAPEALPLAQARAVGDPGPSGAPAEVRDLRLLAAGRGRAPALRRGRPRWPALVGPTRRLPHRDPRPGQGADGQEHGDRPRRREGRLLRQAAARPCRRSRRLVGRGRRVLQDLHPRSPRRDRQPGDR